MAGEIYIARQDTLEAVQDTVEEIDTNVNTIKSALGNFAGGGTEDTVKNLLEEIKELVSGGGGSGISAKCGKKGFKVLYSEEWNSQYLCAIGMISGYIWILRFGNNSSYRIDPETGKIETVTITSPTSTKPVSSIVYNNKIYVFF